MSELMIKDKLIDPVAGLVIIEDITAGGTVKLRVISTGIVLTRSIHYVLSFNRVSNLRRFAWIAIITAAVVAAGVILL